MIRDCPSSGAVNSAGARESGEAKQFGAAIELVVQRWRNRSNARYVDDKGALECILRARGGAARCRTNGNSMECVMKPRRSMLFIPGANAVAEHLRLSTVRTR